eukprot:634242-Rhodomonas_salina.1
MGGQVGKVGGRREVEEGGNQGEREAGQRREGKSSKEDTDAPSESWSWRRTEGRRTRERAVVEIVTSTRHR